MLESRAAGGLTTLSHGAPVNGVGFGYGRNAAGQILSRTTSNTGYAPVFAGDSVDYAVDGLNQYTSAGGATLAHNARGDTTYDGAASYGYDELDRLTSARGATLSYDALGRLYAAGRTRFLYDGADLIGEYDLSGGLMRRYVHGPGVDEPLVAYDGAGTGSRRWLLADERGSVVGSSDAAGSVASTVLDDYGQGAPVSRFGFTGQAWLPEAGVYHFKAHAYSPRLGRFLQPDPSADPDSPSLYAYVGNDPVNMNDPTGLGEAGICLLGDTAGCNNQSSPPPIAQFLVTATPAQIQRAAELRADAATFGVLYKIPPGWYKPWSFGSQSACDRRARCRPRRCTTVIAASPTKFDPYLKKDTRAAAAKGLDGIRS